MDFGTFPHGPRCHLFNGKVFYNANGDGPIGNGGQFNPLLRKQAWYMARPRIAAGANQSDTDGIISQEFFLRIWLNADQRDRFYSNWFGDGICHAQRQHDTRS